MNIIAFFEIQSTNPKREVAFYKSIFGWKATLDESAPLELYRLETDGIQGAILKRPVDNPPTHQGTNAFTCSIQVTDFDATEKAIIKNGGQVAMPKFAVPGKCWQGYFLDADHNVFGVFEVDKNAK